jgi:hypothetical protein
MELIGSLFFVLALVVIIALFVGRPLLLRGGVPHLEDMGQEEDHLRSSLLAERDRVLNALQELDFDYALGKVPAEDYPSQRSALMRTGAVVLRRLDSMGSAVAGDTLVLENTGTGTSAEDRIEAAIAARRADSKIARHAERRNGGAQNDVLEDLIAKRKKQRKESSAGFCPRCGRPVQKSDQFCSRCGATL